MSKRIKLGQLREYKLPKNAEQDTDLIASIRKNCESPHPDGLVLYVPDEMAELIAKPAKPEPPTTAESE